jgi:hypothetical protein
VSVTTLLGIPGVVHARKTDVLVAVMEDHRGEKSVHYQTAPDNNCDKALTAFRELTAEKRRMQLTFTDPPFSGYVVELHCIRPDGTIYPEPNK